MCQALGVRPVVETHGHRDHIQAVPAVREAGYEVAVPAPTPACSPATTCCSRTTSQLERGRLRIRTVHTPGPHPGLHLLRRGGDAAAVHRRHALPRGPGNTYTERRLRHHHPLDHRRHLRRLDPDTIVLPGHGAMTTIGDEAPHLDEWVERGW